MRYFKYILLLFILIPVNSDAQILGRIFGKSASKTTSKVIAKEAGEEIVEKTTKEIAETMATKSINKWGKKNTTKYLYNATSKAARNEIRSKGSKEVMETEVSAIMKDVMEKSAQKGIRYGAIREGSELALKNAGKFTPQYVSAVRKEIIEKTEKEAGTKLSEKQLALSSKNEIKRLGVKEGAKLAADGVETVLGKTAAKIWNEIAQEGGEKATKTLLDDMAEDALLRKTIQKNPDLLRSYYRMLESPMRRDITAIRYLSYNAGKYSRAYPSLAKKYGFGDNLIIKSERGINKIYTNTGEYLGKISGDNMTGYVIECSSTNRTLLNLYPLANSRYVWNNCTWVTDECGRTIRGVVTAGPGPKAKNFGRNSKIQSDVVRLKNGFNTNGDPIKNMHINDEGGHVISLSMGGTNDLINFVPQHKMINRNEGATRAIESAWYRSENAAKAAHDKGKTVTREINLKYSNKNSLRPDNFSITQTIDNEIDILKPSGIYKEECVLDNYLIHNYD